MAWGVVFANVWPRGGARAGAGFAVLPWLVLVLYVLPLVKQGFLFSADKPWIAFSTLAMHLVFGAGMGWTNRFVAERWRIDCRPLARAPAAVEQHV